MCLIKKYQLSMEIKFTIHETPKPKDSTGGCSQHARVLPSGTKRLEDICEYINEASSLNSSDIKGALEAFFKYISFQLRAGYNVELEGLGHFSVSLHSRQVKDEKEKDVVKVEINGVNFRCSPRLRKEVKKSRLKKVKHRSTPFPDIRKRRERMLEYMKSYGSVNQREYAALNACSRYRAANDLKTFVEQGIVACSGGATHKIYLLVDND
jgi:predicted histone-like DNA-binding protein